MWETVTFVVGMGAVAVIAAIVGLAILAALQTPQPKGRTHSIFRENEDETVFLFDGEDLVDATPSALRLLAGSAFTDKPWYALLEKLSARFDNLETRLGEIAIAGSIVLQGTPRADAQPVALRAELRGGLTKITLAHPGRESGVHRGDMLTVHALDSELVELRDAANVAPFPMWRILKSGEITWANEAYMKLLSRLPPVKASANWPLAQLFDISAQKADVKGMPLRRPGPAGDGWFDIAVCKTGEGTQCYALPADSAVLAEGTLEDFKQTLANTFAHLSTGLAVFDRRRKLQLFNPSLAKLIDVPLDVLLRRPTLFALLDAMRDRNMLPEPKDYKSWRHQMADVEETSLRGQYNEVWHLPNGQALRVVGSPYPNGALALMIDDITDQVVRDRLSRGELDLVLAVTDQITEAVIVFSPVGRVLFANAQYRRLWAADPAAGPGKGDFLDELELWRSQSLPSLVWSGVEGAIATGSGRMENLRFTLRDGKPMSCRVIPIAGMGIGVMFQIDSAARDIADAGPHEPGIAMSA
jgi:PAS domain-containing protein